jgi:hypothetical protein
MYPDKQCNEKRIGDCYNCEYKFECIKSPEIKLRDINEGDFKHDKQK